MRLKALILTLLFTASVLQAQTEFRPGYVIELNGDTIFGEIDISGDFTADEACSIKISDNDIRTFYPDQIAAYKVTNSYYFVSRQVEGEYVFLRSLISGRISVYTYYIRNAYSEKIFIEKEGEPMVRLPYEEGTRNVENINNSAINQPSQVFYESTQHIGYLKYYMQDYPEILDKVENVTRPTGNNLINLVREYNDAFDFDKSLKTLEIQKPAAKIAIEPHLSINAFIETFESPEVFPGIATNIYIFFPRISEKVALKMGFETISPLVEEINFRVNKFPLQIQFINPTFKFKPKIIVGINIYQERIGGSPGSMFTVYLGQGLNIRIKENIDFSFSLASETIPILYQEHDFSYSCNFGFMFYL